MNLIWDRTNVQHIARHHVDRDEVEEAAGDPRAFVFRSGKKQSRKPKKFWVKEVPKKKRFTLIGQAASGRYLTLILDEEPDGYYVVTAYDTSDFQIRLYWKHR